MLPGSPPPTTLRPSVSAVAPSSTSALSASSAARPTSIKSSTYANPRPPISPSHVEDVYADRSSHADRPTLSVNLRGPDPGLLGAVRTAEDAIAVLDAVSDDPAAAVLADRGDLLDGAFERVVRPDG